MVPGCITQDRIDISAIVIPLDRLAIALRLRIWPRNVTNTVTKDSSILFAIAAHNREAVLGASFPGLEVILSPYRGLVIAINTQSPEKIVEYTARSNIAMANQWARPWYTFLWVLQS